MALFSSSFMTDEMKTARAKRTATPVSRTGLYGAPISSPNVNPVYGAPLGTSTAPRTIYAPKPAITTPTPTPTPTPYQAPSPTASTASTGATSSTTTPATTATTPAASSADVLPSDMDLEKLRKERLDAALQAIAAEYGVSYQELQAQLGQLGTQYTDLMQGVQEFEKQERQRQLDDAIRRGIGRSGIYASNLTEALKAVANEEARIEGEFKAPTIAAGETVDWAAMKPGDVGTQAYGLAQQAAALTASEDALKKKVEVDSSFEKFDLEAWLASLGITP